MTRDQKIASIATHLICQSSMERDLWRATTIGSLPPHPAVPLKLDKDELPLVSASFPGGDWYAWTTRRLLSVCDQQHYEADCESIVSAEFGMPKGPSELINVTTGPIHSLIATFHSSKGLAARIRYETGYASMGPIQCFKYWELKHPILDKLMTPDELAYYRRQRNQG
ncbi:hypothetical protein [Prosthecobacter fluviatilis]|uniref:Uncharacterized protein n=1 Tax=Prosthecobacter fluviatilis TaxID=445931 RepID=A0ABW0KVC8_9BACT